MRKSTEGPSNVWAIVPVKRLSRAKQRLAPVLSNTERAALARAMLHDVLTTLRVTPELAGIVVVTGDPMVANLATLFDAQVVGDMMETGVNAAVQQGLRILDARSSGALVIPADVPFATVSDVQAVIDELRHYPVVLAPALSDGGTNGLAMRRPDLIVPSFGDDSFARHQALARDAGLGCGIVRSEGLGRDIDYPSDLVPCTESKKFSLTAGLLAEFRLADRPGVTAFPVSKRHM
jgi:2-phospho-L-lactate/phosphoenolpyruvate guanylyltransferase